MMMMVNVFVDAVKKKTMQGEGEDNFHIRLRTVYAVRVSQSARKRN